jgi:hypothetical protein
MRSRILCSIMALAAALLLGCDGNDKPPGDSAPPGDGLVCAGAIDFLADCTADEECMSCVCRTIGHAKFCTKTCAGDADCPAPSGGCNTTAGLCRR